MGPTAAPTRRLHAVEDWPIIPPDPQKGSQPAVPGDRVARSIRHEQPLLVGDALLAAVAYSAERLLLAADWREAVDDVLTHLGVAASVSRAYLIEVDPPASG